MCLGKNKEEKAENCQESLEESKKVGKNFYNTTIPYFLFFSFTKKRFLTLFYIFYEFHCYIGSVSKKLFSCDYYYKIN